MEMPPKRTYYYVPQYVMPENLAVRQSGYQLSLGGHISSEKMKNYFVLHYITAGKGTYYVDGKIYPLGPGDFFIIYPNILMKYQADFKDPWEYYWIGFEGSNCLGLLKQCGITRDHPIFHYSADQRIHELLISVQTLSDANIWQNYSLLSKLYEMFSIMMESASTLPPISKQEQYVNQAIEYIYDCYQSNLTVTEIADYVGLERTYLYRIFREIQGVSPQKFILNYRIEKACHLLLHTAFSLSEIAQYCGFSSQAHLSSSFKKEKHRSPLIYRREMLLDNAQKSNTPADSPQ